MFLGLKNLKGWMGGATGPAADRPHDALEEPLTPVGAVEPDFEPVPLQDIIAALDAEKRPATPDRRREIEGAIREHWKALRRLVSEYHSLDRQAEAAAEPLLQKALHDALLDMNAESEPPNLSLGAVYAALSRETKAEAAAMAKPSAQKRMIPPPKRLRSNAAA
ncbi:MAG TPA: hypothetical protein VED40_18680 [Azospirillaceae bacterium]|nr:hypothetical protein [Azospirillaceae bacterium]